MYITTYRAILALIDRGVFPPGERLPTEPKLARMLAVSRPTLRAALMLLQEDGVVRVARGKGTIVRDRTAEGWKALYNPSITMSIRNAGKTPSTASRSANWQQADAFISRKLCIPLGSKILVVVRTRAADGEPLAHCEDYLPRSEAAERLMEAFGSGEAPESLVDFLSHVGDTPPVTVETNIQPAFLQGQANRDFPDIGSDTLLLLNKLYLDQSDRPVMFAKHYVNPAVLSIHIKTAMSRETNGYYCANIGGKACDQGTSHRPYSR